MSIAAGILVALLVLAGGAAFLFRSSKQWSGQTTVMVLPSQGIAIGPSASYWDTLSRGQITSTVAQVLGLSRFKDLAGQELGLTPAEVSRISIATTSVTGTALVTVTAKGPSAAEAADMSDAVVARADSAVNTLIAPYSVTVVSESGGHASPVATASTSKYLVILAVVAVALGFGVQQGVMQLFEATARRGRDPVLDLSSGDEPGTPPAGEADSHVPVPERGPAQPPPKAFHRNGDGRRTNGSAHNHVQEFGCRGDSPDLLELARADDDLKSR